MPPTLTRATVTPVVLVLALVAVAAPETPRDESPLSVRGVGALDSWDLLGGGRWEARDDRLTQTHAGARTFAYIEDSVASDATVAVRVRIRAEGDGLRAAGLIARSSDSLRAYFVHLDTRHDQVLVHRGDLRDGSMEVARQRDVPLETDRWYEVAVTLAGESLQVAIDGEEVLETQDSTHTAGRFGVYSWEASVEFESLRVDGVRAELPEPWEPHVFEQPTGRVGDGFATVLETRSLSEEGGRYAGWPTIARSPDGALLVAYSGDRGAHISDDGAVRLLRSDDGGATWNDPVTIVDTPLDDRDAGVVVTPGGALLVSWFTAAWSETIPPEVKERWLGNWMVRSTDDGRSWSEPYRSHASTPHGPIALADGRMLVLGQYPHESQGKPYRLVCEESRDDGRTWEIIADFPIPDGSPLLSFDEPHLLEVPRADGEDGASIIALFRDCFGEHFLRQSESLDGGRTWSEPSLTPIRGYPPHALRLESGDVIVAYGKRWAPLGEYVCRSHDGGRSWDVSTEARIAIAQHGDLGYPASVELPDGTIWTVYYQSYRHGRPPSIMGTRWRPSEVESAPKRDDR